MKTMHMFLKGYGKGLIVALAYIFIIQSTAWALPQGGAVESGSVTFDSPNPNTLNINSASDQAIINWQSFNIAQHETVNFNQPSALAAVLNRVVGGGGASSIAGALNSNGTIILVNPAGVSIAQTANINVGSLTASQAASFVASSLNMTSSDFKAGNYIFQKEGVLSSAVINKGMITVHGGGLVMLFGGSVENSGTINAKLGKVILASGDKIAVNFTQNGLISVAVDEKVVGGVVTADGKKVTDAVKNLGAINADGGQVVLTAEAVSGIFDKAVNNEGIIKANTVIERNGVIELVSKTGMTVNKGVVQAKGTAAAPKGGTVKVYGHKAVNDGVIDVAAANGGTAGKVTVNSDVGGTILMPKSLIDASGHEIMSNAGEVLINSLGNTIFAPDARIDISGGLVSGDAGFADVSAHEYLGFYGDVDGFAQVGYKLGELLLDPTEIIVGATTTNDPQLDSQGGSILSSYFYMSPPPQTLYISANKISTFSGPVKLEAMTTGPGTGIISVNNAINKTTAGGLTLTAPTLNINASISAPSVTLGGNNASSQPTSTILGTGSPALTATAGDVTLTANGAGGSISGFGTITASNSVSLASTASGLSNMGAIQASGGQVVVNGLFTMTNSVSSLQSQTYKGAVTLGDNVTLTPGNAAIFEASLNGGGKNLTIAKTVGGVGGGATFYETIMNMGDLSVAGNGEFWKAITGLNSLSVGGNTNLTNAITSINTTAGQTYTGHLSSNAGLTLTTGPGDIQFGTVDTNGNDLIVGPAGVVRLGGNVNTGAGSQTYSKAVTLTGDATLTGNSIILTSTVDSDGTPRALTITDSSDVNLAGGAIGGSSALSSFTVTNGANLGVNVTTKNDQTYSGAVNLTDDATLTSDGTVYFQDALAGAKSLAIVKGTAGGNATFSKAINGLAGLTVDGNADFSDAISGLGALWIGGTTNLAAGITTLATGAGQTYTGAFTSADNLTMSATTGDIIFGSTVDTSGKSLTISPTAGAIRLAGNVDTGGDQQIYSGPVVLTGDVSLIGTGVTCNGTINADAAANDRTLTITSDGPTVLGGAIGGTQALGTFTLTNDGNIGVNITTSGDQTYPGAVAISADAILTSGGTVTFQNVLNGASNLTIAKNGGTGGDAKFLGGVNGLPALDVKGNAEFTETSIVAGIGDLTVGGTTLLKIDSVTTTGNQKYDGTVTLANNSGDPDTGVTLTAGDPKNITFGGDIQVPAGTKEVQLIAPNGAVTFNGIVGSDTAKLVDKLNVLQGTAVIGSSGITTKTQQLYNGPVTVGANTTLKTTGSAGTEFIGLNGVVNADLAANNRELTVQSNAIQFAQPVGGVQSLGALTLTPTGIISLGGNVTTSGVQTYNGRLSLDADATLTGGGIVFDNFVLAANDKPAPSLTVDGPVTINGIDVSGVNTGFVSVMNNMGAGTQTYKGTVTLNAGQTALEASTVEFDGNVTGADKNLAVSLANSTTKINCAAINTGTGSQAYQNVTLLQDTALTGKGIYVSGTLNTDAAAAADRKLTITNTDMTVFSGAVGALKPLSELQVLGGASTAVNANITTDGAMNFSGMLLLDTNMPVKLKGSPVTFAKQVAANTGKNPMLTVDGPLNLNGPGVATNSGSQLYKGNVTLGADVVLSGGFIQFDGTVLDGDTNNYGMTVAQTSTLLTKGAVSIAYLGAVTTNGIAAQAALTAEKGYILLGTDPGKAIAVKGMSCLASGAVPVVPPLPAGVPAPASGDVYVIAGGALFVTGPVAASDGNVLLLGSSVTAVGAPAVEASKAATIVSDTDDIGGFGVIHGASGVTMSAKTDLTVGADVHATGGDLALLGATVTGVGTPVVTADAGKIGIVSEGALSGFGAVTGSGNIAMIAGTDLTLGANVRSVGGALAVNGKNTLDLPAGVFLRSATDMAVMGGVVTYTVNPDGTISNFTVVTPGQINLSGNASFVSDTTKVAVYGNVDGAAPEAQNLIVSTPKAGGLVALVGNYGSTVKLGDITVQCLDTPYADSGLLVSGTMNAKSVTVNDVTWPVPHGGGGGPTIPTNIPMGPSLAEIAAFTYIGTNSVAANMTTINTDVRTQINPSVLSEIPRDINLSLDFQQFMPSVQFNPQTGTIASAFQPPTPVQQAAARAQALNNFEGMLTGETGIADVQSRGGFLGTNPNTQNILSNAGGGPIGNMINTIFPSGGGTVLGVPAGGLPVPFVGNMINSIPQLFAPQSSVQNTSQSMTQVFNVVSNMLGTSNQTSQSVNQNAGGGSGLSQSVLPQNMSQQVYQQPQSTVSSTVMSTLNQSLNHQQSQIGILEMQFKQEVAENKAAFQKFQEVNAEFNKFMQDYNKIENPTVEQQTQYQNMQQYFEQNKENYDQEMESHSQERQEFEQQMQQMQEQQQQTFEMINNLQQTQHDTNQSNIQQMRGGEGAPTDQVNDE